MKSLLLKSYFILYLTKRKEWKTISRNWINNITVEWILILGRIVYDSDYIVTGWYWLNTRVNLVGVSRTERETAVSTMVASRVPAVSAGVAPECAPPASTPSPPPATSAAAATKPQEQRTPLFQKPQYQQ